MIRSIITNVFIKGIKTTVYTLLSVELIAKAIFSKG